MEAAAAARSAPGATVRVLKSETREGTELTLVESLDLGMVWVPSSCPEAR